MSVIIIPLCFSSLVHNVESCILFTVGNGSCVETVETADHKLKNFGWRNNVEGHSYSTTDWDGKVGRYLRKIKLFSSKCKCSTAYNRNTFKNRHKTYKKRKLSKLFVPKYGTDIISVSIINLFTSFLSSKILQMKLPLFLKNTWSYLDKHFLKNHMYIHGHDYTKLKFSFHFRMQHSLKGSGELWENFERIKYHILTSGLKWLQGNNHF